jgi:glycosyltransferase involved in cell wall biosynthesis
MKKTCVLIPSYNEAKTIGGIVHALKAMGLTAYVVDDGSTDETGRIAKTEGAVVIRNNVNKGKGASIQEGLNIILKSDFDSVLIMDGDGQHSIEDIPYFFKRMEATGADIIIGNRMLDTSRMPLIRIWTNLFMSGLISSIAGQKIEDSQCGFRLFKRGVLDSVRLRSTHYDAESEIIIVASRKGFKIESVPVKTVYEGEKSRINPFVDTIRFIALIFRSFFKR